MSSADPRNASLFGSIGRRHHRLDLCSCDGAGLGSSLGLELSRAIHLLGRPCLHLCTRKQERLIPRIFHLENPRCRQCRLIRARAWENTQALHLVTHRPLVQKAHGAVLARKRPQSCATCISQREMCGDSACAY